MGRAGGLVSSRRCDSGVSRHAESRTPTLWDKAHSGREAMPSGEAILRRPIRTRSYAGRIVLNLAQVTPHVSGPDTVQVMESGRRDREKEGGDPEGVSRLLRQFAAGGSGGGRKRLARQENRRRACSSISLPPAAQSRKRPKRAESGRSSSMPAPILCRRDAARVSGWALDC